MKSGGPFLLYGIAGSYPVIYRRICMVKRLIWKSFEHVRSFRPCKPAFFFYGPKIDFQSV